MKIKTVIAFSLVIFACSANAEAELSEAPVSVVRDFVNLCSEYATEEGIKEDKLDSYLFECVNAELEEQNWKKVNELPKDSD